MTPEHQYQCDLISENINARIQDCVDDLKSHIVEEEKKVNTIHEDIKIIKENHLYHIEKSMGKLETNQDWLMKTYWLIASSAVGGLVAGVLNLLK